MSEQGPEPTADADAIEPLAEEAAADPALAGADLARRKFFRQFATDIFHTAATVVGAATAIQRSSVEAASAILNPNSLADNVDATAAAADASPDSAVSGITYAPSLPARTAPGELTGSAIRRPTGPPTGYRSAFRAESDRIILVNQRRLPNALVEVECRTAIDVANEIGDRTIVGGPALAQVAALGLALSAHRLRSARPYARRAILRAAATTLGNAAPSSRQLQAAVERVMGRYLAIGELDEDGDRIADTMQREADAIAFETNDDHGRIVDAALAHLPETPDGPLRVLTLGSTGTLASGQFGTALAVLQAAHHAERLLAVSVLEGRPTLDGARVVAWELTQSGVPHTLVVDAAAGGLIQSGKVDVVLVGAAAIAANGDVSNVIGTCAAASIAAQHGVPVIVCSPLAAVDSSAATGADLATEERPAAEVLEYAKVRVAPADAMARNPVVDVTPASLITGIATEEGFLVAPFGQTLPGALLARAIRLPASAPQAHGLP